MISNFEVGKYYKWIGPSYFYDNWSPEMEAWKDGEPKLCTSAEQNPSKNAMFEGIPCPTKSFGWMYSHCIEYFKEVKVCFFKQEELEI